MAGRIPKLNWTPYRKQYTCTIAGKFHMLGADKDKAEAQFKFLLRQLEDGGPADPSIPFADIADIYLDFVEEHFSPGRYRICKERLQSFKDHLGNGFKAKELRAKHVEEWIAAKTLTNGSERLYKAIILACMNWAARPKGKKGGGLIAANPIRGQLSLPVGESRGKDAVWTQETYEQVLRYANPAFADLVRILAWTGARPSTIIRIQKRHYNKAQSRWDCEDLYRGRTSTKKYVRHVRLLNQEARDLVERRNAEFPEGPIFRNAFGKPWTPEAPQIYLWNMQEKFEASRDLKWQDGLVVYGLRHTFATNFLQQYPGEIEYLRVLLGHKDYTMLFEHYGHLIDQHASAFKRVEGFSPFRK